MSAKMRIHLLDEIRGFCVFCMVFDHALFTLGYVFYHGFSQKMFDILAYISPLFALTFVLISGVSCILSRNNLNRGIKILCAAFVVTLFSLFIMSDAPIIFGVLHLLGCCAVLYAVTEKLIEKIPASLGLILCLVLFLFTYNTDRGYLGFEPLCIHLPQKLYEQEFLMVFGFRPTYSAYSDYFPLLPWMFAFFSGVFAGRKLKEQNLPEGIYKSRVPFFSLLGTNAFFVYLVHQPLIFGVYYIISLFGGL